MHILTTKKITSISTHENLIKRIRKNIYGPNNLESAIISHYLFTKDKELKKLAILNAENLIHKNLPATAMKIDESLLKKLIGFPKKINFRQPQNPKFTFIDLFAGIGGFRIAMNRLGGKCIFSSEWDKEAQKTYQLNFGEIPFGDITTKEVQNKIPDQFDILCAGFPCQAFSIAGRREGFQDTRGTLFFEVEKIIKKHQPKAIFLENVKGLVSHDKGNTLKTILDILRNKLNYFVPDPEIINAKYFGVPQNRERIFIVGFRKDLGIKNFKYPNSNKVSKKLKDILEEDVVESKYYLSQQYLNTLKKHRSRHESKGNGFGYEIIAEDQVANAIVLGGMGKERNLVRDYRLTDFTPTTRIKGEINSEGVRRMTPREWARLQGYPDKFKIEVADESAYNQFGNSVAVPAIQATGKKIVQLIEAR